MTPATVTKTQALFMKLTLSLSLLYLYAASFVYAADNLPPPFKASYTLHAKGMQVGLTHSSWKRFDNGEFSYRQETKSTGPIAWLYQFHIVEESRGNLYDEQLRPLKYHYQELKGKQRNIHTKFDWINMQASNNRDAQITLPIQSGTTDNLLYQIDLMHKLRTSKHPTTFSYQVIDRRELKLKSYHFELLGKEPIKTPIGQFNAIKLRRQKPDQKKSITLWCAPEMHYLPVKIEVREKSGLITTLIQTWASQ